MKKENSSKEFYLQRLNKNQSNSQKNPLKFLAFYVGRSKTENSMQVVVKVEILTEQQKLFFVPTIGRTSNQCLRPRKDYENRFRRCFTNQEGSI